MPLRPLAYPPAYRERIIALARAGPTAKELAAEFEPSQQAIRNGGRHTICRNPVTLHSPAGIRSGPLQHARFHSGLSVRCPTRQRNPLLFASL